MYIYSKEKKNNNKLRPPRELYIDENFDNYQKRFKDFSQLKIYKTLNKWWHRFTDEEKKPYYTNVYVTLAQLNSEYDEELGTKYLFRYL